MRGGGKPDANQGPIVVALRKAGYSVAITSGVSFGFPDLIVGRCQRNLLMEVKTKGGKLNPDQEAFHSYWKGQTCVVFGISDALTAADRYLRKETP